MGWVFSIDLFLWWEGIALPYIPGFGAFLKRPFKGGTQFPPMTSWLHVPRKSKREEEEGPRTRNYFLTLESGEFTTYFLSLFNAHVFSNINRRSLYVYDNSSPISTTYSLLKEAFEPMKDVNYVSEMMSGVTVLAGRSDARYNGALTQIATDVLRRIAAEALKWSPSILEKVRQTLAERRLPAKFDAAVHIRSRSRFDTVRAPATGAYVAAVEAAVRSKVDLSGNPVAPNIFVLASSDTDFIDFQNQAPKTWKLFQISPTVGTIRGINIGSFNRQNSAVKLNAYIEHVTELYCMQNATTTIGTLSTDIGRFLYLTTPSFKSLDVHFVIP